MNHLPDFIPGLDLCEAFYWEAVRPIILRRFPDTPHSAALIGYGSDVIGCDTPMSRDHQWGPRMVVFLPPIQFAKNRKILHETLRHELPVAFRGYPTHFGPSGENGVRVMTPIEQGPVEHLVEIVTIEDYFQRSLGVDPYCDPEPAEWLTFQEHILLTLTAGRVFHDDLDLEQVRARFSYYPHDIWLYLLSAQWGLIDQEEPFMGRTGQNQDEVGSRLIAARQVDRLMRLCYLMERRYAPYSKWFGVVFHRLECAGQMLPLLMNVLNGQTWQQREAALTQAYQLAAHMHNCLDITPVMPETVSSFFDRPYQVIHAGEFAEAIRAAIKDPAVRKLPPLIGSVNQFMVESSNARQSIEICRKARSLFS